MSCSRKVNQEVPSGIVQCRKRVEGSMDCEGSDVLFRRIDEDVHWGCGGDECRTWTAKQALWLRHFSLLYENYFIFGTQFPSSRYEVANNTILVRSLLIVEDPEV